MSDLETILKQVAQESALWGFKSGISHGRIVDYEFRSKSSARWTKFFHKQVVRFVVGLVLFVWAGVGATLLGIPVLANIMWGGAGFALSSVVFYAIMESHHKDEGKMYHKFLEEWKDFREKNSLGDPENPDQIKVVTVNPGDFATHIHTEDHPVVKADPDTPAEDPEFDAAVADLLRTMGEHNDDNA